MQLPCHLSRHADALAQRRMRVSGPYNSRNSDFHDKPRCDTSPDAVEFPTHTPILCAYQSQCATAARLLTCQGFCYASKLEKENVNESFRDGAASSQILCFSMVVRAGHRSSRRTNGAGSRISNGNPTRMGCTQGIGLGDANRTRPGTEWCALSSGRSTNTAIAHWQNDFSPDRNPGAQWAWGGIRSPHQS